MILHYPVFSGTRSENVLLMFESLNLRGYTYHTRGINIAPTLKSSTYIYIYNYIYIDTCCDMLCNHKLETTKMFSFMCKASKPRQTFFFDLD